MHRGAIVIVTPALADANNGNWQTARRWAAMLRARHPVQVVAAWPSPQAPDAPDAPADPALMIALHARRSAPSIAAWRALRPRAPLAVALTGTDLYRDILTDASAQRSLELADALVVLNELGPQRLPGRLQARCRVVLQSCSARAVLPRTTRHLRALMVGHLRAEKDPGTFLRAAQRLQPRADILLDHIGRALEPPWGERALELARAHPRYRWLGGLDHAATRRRIQAAHVLVHCSVMEGGAHVVTEAVRSGTPVLASRIDGNLGLLGADYAGCFEPGDDAALARLLERARDDPDMLALLSHQIARRAPLFEPAAEAAALHRVVDELLEGAAP